MSTETKLEPGKLYVLKSGKYDLPKINDISFDKMLFLGKCDNFQKDFERDYMRVNRLISIPRHIEYFGTFLNAESYILHTAKLISVNGGWRTPRVDEYRLFIRKPSITLGFAAWEEVRL